MDGQTIGRSIFTHMTTSNPRDNINNLSREEYVTTRHCKILYADQEPHTYTLSWYKLE